MQQCTADDCSGESLRFFITFAYISSKYSGGLGRGELAGRFSGLGELELTALDEESIKKFDLIIQNLNNNFKQLPFLECVCICSTPLMCDVEALYD
jgi:hypothetical protein